MHSKLRPSPAMVVALIALFVSLGGTAAALSGSNTVFSDDIVDNQVYSADVRNDTLAGGGLAAADLKPSSVGTSEAVNNSFTGNDILESSLAKVPNADKLDGKDSSAFVSGNGTLYQASRIELLGDIGPVLIVPGVGTVGMHCTSDSGMSYHYVNQSGGIQRVHEERPDGTLVAYGGLANGANTTPTPATPNGAVTYRVGNGEFDVTFGGTVARFDAAAQDVIVPEFANACAAVGTAHVGPG